MTVAIESAKRVFLYNGMELPDPDCSMDLNDVKTHYTSIYPELMNSTLEGPKVEQGSLNYTFVRGVRDKA